MTVWEAISAEAHDDLTLWLVGLFAFTLTCVHVLARREQVRLKAIVSFMVMHVVALPVAAGLRASGSAAYTDVRVPCLIFEGVAASGMVGILVFSVLLPRLRVRVPRILQDVIVAGMSLISALTLASRNGINLSGIIATSAVLTAVIGFSLQDWFGNIMGGLALQLDNSIDVGDWIKVNDIVGKVTEIRWRYTAVETRNWETVILPNSVIMKNQVSVLGRRNGETTSWRRWVYFNVDYRFQPSDVIDCVNAAVRAAKIERVADDPAPNCVLMDLGDSSGRYAVRYWLTDLAVDDPTDSLVRTVIYFALKRADIPLSIPAHALFVTQESTDRRAQKSQEGLKQRINALSRVELFAKLTDEERAALAASMRYAPFTRGEIVTRQGAEAHWLYLICDGEVSVRVTAEGGLEREVAKLSAGSFMGEMSLMTGERRSATVVALSDVECFRLDKAAFQEVLHKRPEMAEYLAGILAKRRVELEAAREGLDQAARERRMVADKNDILLKIRSFFGLADDARRGAA